MNALPHQETREAIEPWTLPEGRSFELLSADCSLLEQVFQSRSLVRADGEVVPLDVFIPPKQGDLLFSLVRYLRPRCSIEVGLANGISAVHIAKAIQDNGTGRHLAIDPFQQQDWHNVGLATLRRANLDSWVQLDSRPSHIALPDAETRALRVQFAFIDGSHLFDYVMSDFLAIDRILDIDGMIAFDDSDWPAIDRVIRFALTNRHYRIFDPGIVIEPGKHAPRWITRRVRSIAAKSQTLRRLFSHAFIFPSQEMGIQGRCVTIQKISHDDRDCQQRHFCAF